MHFQADSRQNVPVPLQPMSAHLREKHRSPTGYVFCKDCEFICHEGSNDMRLIIEQVVLSRCGFYHTRPALRNQDLSSIRRTRTRRKGNWKGCSNVHLQAGEFITPNPGPIAERSQPVPIPSYLIAIAAGNVRYHACPSVEGKQWKTGVWAEPEFIDSAYWEFGDAINRYTVLARRPWLDTHGVYSQLHAEGRVCVAPVSVRCL